MNEFLLMVGLILLILSTILNIITARKRGKKGVAAFFMSIASLLVSLSLYLILITLDPSQNRANALGMLALAGSLIGLSISTFLFYKNDGASGWKRCKVLNKVVISVMLLPTIALLAADIIVAANHNSTYNQESAVIADTIAQIEREPSWPQKVEIYKSATIDQLRKRNEVEPTLRASIGQECPNIEDIWSRPNVKEDWIVYEEYGPPLPIPRYKERLGKQPVDAIFSGLKELLAFYREVDIPFKPINKVIYYDFPRYSFHESVNMRPDLEDYQNSKSIAYDSQYKYMVLYQDRNKNLFMLTADMISFQTVETLPASLDEVDMAIVVADFAAGNAAHYTDGSAAVGLRTNICVYDYRTGELLGLIDTIYQGPSGWVSNTRSGMPDSPTSQAQSIVGTFFNIY